ncbi:MAG: 3-deoxy-D-manno-octulosonic acid transferase, partial [Desulfobacteraceae bacterium]|nr:3-deoxy-D-manno-octulosonic acid transferase [Desulfobacteraceae bacterium]
LVPVGGHNLLEPAMHGVPVLTGPYTHNFREITTSLMERNACRVIRTTDDFISTLEEFLDNEDLRREAGHAAKTVSGIAIGASDRNCSALRAFLGSKAD